MINNRFVNNTLFELQEANHSPIFGYEELPVRTLEEAVEKLIPFISHLKDYVATAKQKCNWHSTLLTRDESAAIYLYSMSTPFFSKLNEALRNENRAALKPWFGFLKLFMTAIKKLPSTPKPIWRGVTGDVSSIFADNDIHIWWSINSCSSALDVIERFLGNHGTLFAINAVDGKDISIFTAIPNEKEIILMPGTHVRAICTPTNFYNRLRIVHLEEINSQSESKFESIDVFQQIKQEYQRNSRIERFMNPSMSYQIEQSYINLAIVKANEHREKEKQLRDVQGAIAVMGTFEEIYSMKTAIDIMDIFKTCKYDEKQVLVFGRAGIGKSTFCRYIAYKWATGSYWTHYELLALIPLRRLTADRYPPLPPGQSYSLVNLVKKELFREDLSEMAEELLKKQFDPKKTLWILDGYDEIIQNIPSHLQCLLEQLLKTPNHVITSRPYLNTLSYDIQMEITGFTDENIENYVQNFFHQMKNGLDNSSLKGEKLLSFLRSNSSVWGVAHIPVNLELICSRWSNEEWSETEQLTMTRLYTMMTEWLCRRYLSRQDNQIRQLTQQEIEQCCQNELLFLESLAFNAMKSNTIIIQPFLLQKAWNESKISSQRHPHILNMGILKSMHLQGIGHRIEMEKDHYFVHLSFQEYFTARYLINALKKSENKEAIDFIKHEKYNQRYTLVFNFLAGLVSKGDAKPCSKMFWDCILGKPLDLVGIRHMQLVISFMEETTNKSNLPQCVDLLEWMASCIKYSFTAEDHIIRTHLSQSLQRAQSVACDQTITKVLIDLLERNDVETKAKVLSFIADLKISNPSVAFITSIAIKLEDKNKKVKEYACEALGNLGEKEATSGVVSKLISALGDESDHVRNNVCEALGNIGKKAATNDVINMLVSAIEDQSSYVRGSTCLALGNIGKKAATKEVISKLVSALEDQSEHVRQDACRALKNIGEKAGTSEVINKLVNAALRDESDDARRNACFALAKIADKVATNEVIDKLVSALEDQSDHIRSGACKALRNIGEKAATSEVISKLVSAAGDQSYHVRLSACFALGKMGAKAATNEVLSKLVSALENQTDHIRSGACEALENIGEKAATSEIISKLVSVLKDKSEDVRSSACFALGKIADKEATTEVISKLASALEDENENVRASACFALGNIGEKAVTGEMISKLFSALGDQSHHVRQSACIALGSIGEKAATNEVINKLVSVLEDKSEIVRANACFALGNIGEKAASGELISKLFSALEDESEIVRANTCFALGNIGEKAATGELISKLFSALGDQSDHVRQNACIALGSIGEKAATNEVISKIIAIRNSNIYWVPIVTIDAIASVLSSSTVITHLDPKIIADLCLSDDASDCFRNVLENDLIKIFLDTKNPDLLSVITRFTLLKGVAMVALKDKVVIYGMKERSELLLSSSELRHKLVSAFTDQRRRLRLCFEIPPEG